MMLKYFLGIDVGTQGVRVLLVDQHGETIAGAQKDFVLDDLFRQEQSTNTWWETCEELVDELISSLSKDVDRSAIVAASVTSTSGTVIPLDKNNEPLSKAIMYSDPRSITQGERIKKCAQEYNPEGYTGFNASSGLSKILWYVENNPDKVIHITRWVHAADYIVGKLSSVYGITDYTNALKSGYDLQKLEWPSFIHVELGLDPNWFPSVVPSGTVVGKLDSGLAARWGIGEVALVVGLTDGCASQMASGAVKVGDWNTTIGTTMVIKGVTKSAVNDPLGRVYSHRHPQGQWMPGGASNTGADWVTLDFAHLGLEKLNKAAQGLIPTGKLAWPLKQQGERYPIMAPQARAIVPVNLNAQELYAANMEGVAFLERFAYECIEELSGEKVGAVYTAGGASKSDVWLMIRASVLNLPIFRCKETSGALGAAIIAASQTFYSTLTQACENMTSVDKKVMPEAKLVQAYELQYKNFKKKLIDLGYLE